MLHARALAALLVCAVVVVVVAADVSSDSSDSSDSGSASTRLLTLDQAPLCSSNDTSPGATYCFYRNPTAIAQVIVGYLQLGPNASCDSTDLNGTCSYVSKMTTYGTSNTDRDFLWIAAGMPNGGFVVFELLSYHVAFLQFEENPPPNTPPLNLIASYGWGYQGYTFAGSIGGNTLKLFYENSTVRLLNETHINPYFGPMFNLDAMGQCGTVTFTGYALQQILLFNDTTYSAQGIVVLAALVTDANGDYSIIFTSVENCENVNTNYGQWNVDADEIYGELVMQYFLQNVGNSSTVLNVEISTDTNFMPRIMFALHDEQSASIYCYNGTRSTTVGFGDITAPSTFYHTEGNGTIDALMVLPEVLRRVNISIALPDKKNHGGDNSLFDELMMFDGSSSYSTPAPSSGSGGIPLSVIEGAINITGDPSQALQIAVSLSLEGGGYWLELFGLPEFGLFNAKQAKVAPIENPLMITVDCPPRQWYNTRMLDCQERNIEAQPLGAPTVLMDFGTVGSPAGNASQQQFASSGISTMTGLLRTVLATRSTAPLTQLLTNAWYNVLVVTDAQKHVSFFGAQELFNTSGGTNFELFREFTTLGPIESISMTPNSQYVFSSIYRHTWEMESKQRLYDVCHALYIDPTDMYLQSYEPLCTQYNNTGFLSPPGFYDFVTIFSSCPPTGYCPTRDTAEIDLLPPGSYPIYPFAAYPCWPGTFCPTGATQEKCPPGFICPFPSMSLPIPCEPDPTFSTTCVQWGLTAPMPCPLGAACTIPGYFPQLAPPGFMMSSNGTRDLMPCEEGDWCGLGRSNGTDVFCPPYSVCPDDSVLEPTLCSCNENACSYCPEGTFVEIPCPAGWFCPNQSAKVECFNPQYCPMGSVIYKSCSEGFYCPTPAQQIPCPEGYYCPLGTITPRPCPILTVCPVGTANIRHGFLGILVLLLIILIIVAVSCVWSRMRANRRKKSEQAHMLKEQLKNDEAKALLQPVDPTLHSIESGSDRGDSVYDTSDYGTTSGSNNSYLGFEPRTHRIDFRFEELGLKLKNGGKTVLAGVTGRIRSGRVTAVMGPSGAGKTTFLSVLSGKVDFGTVTGRIFINGREETVSQYKKFVGFVPQEDVMLRELTVKEILKFSANTRLPVEMNERQRATIVNAIIETLGLYRVRHERIGDESQRGISGGQRKRVNIGMELVAGPTVLFLDEPTSGLDSASSMVVCNVLRNFAEKLGWTIVTVIHQPRYEIFTMFHDVLLLGEGGRTCFLGPSTEAINYFQKCGFEVPPHVNPPDFFMDVLAGSVPRKGDPDFKKVDLFRFWEEHQGSNRDSLISSHGESTNEHDDEEAYVSIAGESHAAPWPPAARQKTTAGFLYQLYLFIIRSFVQQTRMTLGLVIDAVLVMIAGLFIGVVFLNFQYQGPVPAPVAALCPDQIRPICDQPVDNPLPSVASLCSLSVALTAVAASLKIFGGEKIVFWREASTGVSPLAYFLGKNIANIPLMLISPLLFLGPFYQLAVPRAGFFLYYAVLICITFTSASFGILVSVLIPEKMVQLAAVVSILISMMFSGARPTLPEIKLMFFPLPYMPYTSFLRWAQEAMTIIELGTYNNIYSLQSTLDDMGYVNTATQVAVDLFAVIMIGLIVRTIAYFILVLKDRGKQK